MCHILSKNGIKKEIMHEIHIFHLYYYLYRGKCLWEQSGQKTQNVKRRYMLHDHCLSDDGGIKQLRVKGTEKLHYREEELGDDDTGDKRHQHTEDEAEQSVCASDNRQFGKQIDDSGKQYQKQKRYKKDTDKGNYL